MENCNIYLFTINLNKTKQKKTTKTCFPPNTSRLMSMSLAGDPHKVPVTCWQLLASYEHS